MYMYLWWLETHTTSSLNVVWRTWYFLSYHLLELAKEDLVWPLMNAPWINLTCLFCLLRFMYKATWSTGLENRNPQIAWCRKTYWMSPKDKSSMCSYTIKWMGSFLIDQGRSCGFVLITCCLLQVKTFKKYNCVTSE